MDRAAAHVDARHARGDRERPPDSLGVGGTTLSALDLTVNAGDATIDATGTSIGNLDLTVNAGHAGVTLGGPTAGSITINAGKVDVCVPPNAALRLEVPPHFAFDTNLDERGLSQSGQTWQRAGSGAADHPHHQGNAADFELDPRRAVDEPAAVPVT